MEIRRWGTHLPSGRLFAQTVLGRTHEKLSRALKSHIAAIM
jgi:hypothetical protein